LYSRDAWHAAIRLFCAAGGEIAHSRSPDRCGDAGDCRFNRRPELLFYKDERGFTRMIRKKNEKASFVSEISVKDLLAKDLDDLIIERPCLEILLNSEVLDKIQIINGLEKGNLTKALNGKHVGTIIYKS